MEQNIIKSGEWGTCIWSIDETGLLVIGEGTGGSINIERPVPWEDVRRLITAVSVIGQVNFMRGTSLKGMFKDCENLVEVNIGKMDTSEVIDMNSMFENCSSLKELDLSNFNTVKTEDMGRMFSGCRSLFSLDLSSFNTRRARNMHNMFARCSKLQGLYLGENFSTVGNGRTDCGSLAIRESGKYRMAKVINVKDVIVTYHENRGMETKIERETVSGVAYVVEGSLFERPAPEYKFFGWNDKSDGSGKVYLPGDEIASADDDMDFYAVWIRPPRVGDIEPIEEFSYGQVLPFKIPEIITDDNKDVYGYLEISATGKAGSWSPIERNAILPVSCNGYLLRMCATNKCGTSVSNAVPIRIRKGDMDLSKACWTETANMIYDGAPKEVWLEGLPEGVTPVYKNNRATEAGSYSTSVELNYDEENYNRPARIKNHEWAIKKATLDMTGVEWDYEESFVYDGTEQSVRLIGLPVGVEPEYTGNIATDAGIMTASVSFNYDQNNYEAPDCITPCVWEIRKKCIDAGEIKWSEHDDFTYDGFVKSVTITNLPEDAEVEYAGVEEVQAGRYLASANLIGNYCSNLPIEHEWEIRKAGYDMSGVKWNYTGPFTYNRELHEVNLTGIPSGLEVRYENHVATDSGDYIAIASFQCKDPHNYRTPSDMTLKWSIQKAVKDMSEARWTYTEPFEYDGERKSVDIEGLPDGVFATIDNGTATNAGTHIAHAMLKYDEKNYIVEQPADCRWQINKAKLDMSDVHWSYEEPFDYDGNLKSVTLVNIPEGLNVNYTDNAKIDAGKYVATAKLTPCDQVNYETPEINGCAWSIRKSTLEKGDIVWLDDRDLIYDGNGKSVRIISDISDKIKVEYTGETAVNAGKHEAIATFYPTDTVNYEAPEPIHHEWTIHRGDFELTGAAWNYSEAFVYDGLTKKVQLTGLPEGVTVRYENNAATEVGEYTAVADFELHNADNYNPLEPITLKWTIAKATYDLTGAAWQDEINYVYDGEEKAVVINGLPNEITPIYTDNRASDAGEYIAGVEFRYDEHNYEQPVFPECRWRIEKAVYDVGNAAWDYAEPFIYNGEEKRVEIVDLPEGATVVYENAIGVNAGIYYASAEIIPEDTSNYRPHSMTGLTWRIEKSDYDMSSASWDYERAFRYDGLEKSIAMKGLPEGVSPVYDGNFGIEAGIYTARAGFTIADSDNYNVPAVEPCRWEISKTDVDMSGVRWEYDEPITYDGKMQEIVLSGLPKGVKALYSNNCATDTGHYTASAELVLDDNTNYNIPHINDCEWEIVKANYDMSEVFWDYDRAKGFNSREQGIYLENLPNGVTASYTGNEAVDAGRYTAKAELTVSDGDNFNVPVVSPCDWEIAPADIDMSSCKWDFVPGSFVYDETEKGVNLTGIPDEVSTVKYSGEKAVSAGAHIATAEFEVTNNNYNTPAPVSCLWEIEKANCDMSGVKWEYIDEFTYDGSVHGIELRGLPDNVTVTYENNRETDAGEYRAIAKFNTDAENFKIPESMDCVWTINKANYDISEVRWDYDRAFVYDGSEKTIKLAGVPDGLEPVYTGNAATAAGRYSAHAELIPVDGGNWNTPVEIDTVWEIIKADYDMAQTSWVRDRSFIYDGEVKGVTVDGYPSGITPVYEGSSAVGVGEYTAHVNFEYDAENYNEPVVDECTWEIRKAEYDLSKVSWDYEEAFVYDGSCKTVKLVNLPDGLNPVYSNNEAVDAGDYYAEVEFVYDDINYEKPTFEGCRWTIERADAPVNAEELTWTYEEAFVYDGRSHCVGLATELVQPDTVQNENNSWLGKLFSGNRKPELEPEPQYSIVGVPDDFEVIIEENEKTDVGVYYAKATLKPRDNTNYKDFVVDGLRWEIKKATIDVSGVKWDYTSPFTYDGEEKSVQLVEVPPQLTVSYTDNVATAAGEYEAHATFKLLDEKNYQEPKDVRGCLWKIDKASYDMSLARWTYDEDKIYDGKEQMVEVVGLPEGVEAEAYSGNKAIEAGAYTAEVTLSYENTDNYNVPEMPVLRWKIQRRRISTENISWNYNESSIFVYDETLKEVKLVGVPKDVDVTYISNSAINAGDYVAKARLIYDTENCIADDIPDLAWRIEKATFDTSNVAWSYEEPFEYDGEVKKIYLRNVPNKMEIRYMDNKATEVGTYTAKAYLTYNRDNYNVPDIDTTIEWEIARNRQ